jgi:hypothetical protein
VWECPILCRSSDIEYQALLLVVRCRRSQWCIQYVICPYESLGFRWHADPDIIVRAVTGEPTSHAVTSHACCPLPLTLFPHDDLVFLSSGMSVRRTCYIICTGLRPVNFGSKSPRYQTLTRSRVQLCRVGILLIVKSLKFNCLRHTQHHSKFTPTSCSTEHGLFYASLSSIFPSSLVATNRST